jgi:hypothetical protein
MASTDLQGASDTLNGWKEIAAYLGKSVRSVQRWERELNLPVHRINTPDGGQIIFANRPEIDAWKRAPDNGHPVTAVPPEHDAAPIVGDQAVETPATSRNPTPQHRGAGGQLLFFLAGLAVGAVSVALLRFTIPGRPDRFELDDNKLHALTASGNLVWTYAFARNAHHPGSSRRTTLQGDVDGDGSVDIVAAVRFAAPATRSAYSDSVFAFRRNGTVIWQVQPVLQVSHKGQTFEGPWHIRDFAISPDRGRPRVWIVYTHATWRPGFVLEVEPDGRSTIRYMQSGWLHVAAYWPQPSGAYLAIGGIANEYSRASLALVRVDGSPAQSVPNGDDPIVCEGCPRANPSVFYLFPPSELTEYFFRPYNWVKRLQSRGSELTLGTDEGFGEGSIVRISPDLRVMEFERSDQYWQAHRTLENQGRVDHTSENCPDRQAAHEVRVWEPRAGWQQFTVESSIRPPIRSRR